MSVACSTYGVRRGVYRILVGKPEKRDHLEDPGVDGKIILPTSRRSIFGKWEVGCGAWTSSIWLRIERGGGLL